MKKLIYVFCIYLCFVFSALPSIAFATDDILHGIPAISSTGVYTFYQATDRNMNTYIDMDISKAETRTIKFVDLGGITTDSFTFYIKFKDNKGNKDRYPIRVNAYDVNGEYIKGYGGFINGEIEMIDWFVGDLLVNVGSIEFVQNYNYPYSFYIYEIYASTVPDPEEPPEEEPEEPEEPGNGGGTGIFDGGVLVAIEKFILQIFSPVTNFLNSALDYLDNVRLQPARVLNLDYFLGPISMLGLEWRSLIGAVIGSITILFMVFVVKGAYNLYLMFKQGVKWW